MKNEAIKSAVTLGAIAAICTLLVATTWQLTRERVRANEKAMLEQSLHPAIPGITFDGDVTGSVLELEPPHGLPGSDPAVIYRVFSNGEPAAALFAVTARDGYAGPIRVLVGITWAGTVTGVRILEHRETPGLGDRITSDRSDWVYQFDDKSIGDPPLPAWRLKTDGGQFDQLTGASVTPRAVLRAVRETLIYFNEQREQLFAIESETNGETEEEVQ